MAEIPKLNIRDHTLLALKSLRDGRIYFATNGADRKAHRDDYDKAVEWVSAAKSRIGELEQERGAEGTNWFPESFVSQLQAQLAAVTQEKDTLRDLHRNTSNSWLTEKDRANRAEAALGGMIAMEDNGIGGAIARAMAGGGIMCNYDPNDIHPVDTRHAGYGFHGDDKGNFICDVHEIHRRCAQISQLQAHNKRLRDALQEADSTLCACRHSMGDRSKCSCDIHAAHRIIRAALTEEGVGS